MRVNIVRFVKFVFSAAIILLIWLGNIFLKDDLLTHPKTESGQTLKDTQSHYDVDTDLPSMKYTLVWTETKDLPLIYMGEGNRGFIERKCPHTNCYVTGNRSFFADHSKFDAIIFNLPEIFYYLPKELPVKRSAHQKYVFTSSEPAYEYPICEGKFNDFFNWTWTYRLDSDVTSSGIVVKMGKKIIGPSVKMHWMAQKDMKPVSEELKHQLKSKTEAAAWLVSHCDTSNHREKFARSLADELGSRYDLGIDVYGKCSDKSCPNHTACAEMIKKRYYFYLAFEKASSEDYVTENLLHALRNDAVPLVYGGADYTRFMPNGSYLNANELGVEELAKKMMELIINPKKYYEYFRWRNHYSFHQRRDSVATDDYCTFCSMLNDVELMKRKQVYEDLGKWWTPINRCKDADIVNVLKIIG